MKNKSIFLCALALALNLWACKGNGENADTPTQDSTATTNITPVSEQQPTTQNASTLEGFWAIFQEAVAKKDVEKLKSISNMKSIEADFYGEMFFENFQAKVAASTAANVKEDDSNTFGEGAYEFKVEEGDEDSGSAWSLYIKKNAAGNFEICGQMAFG